MPLIQRFYTSFTKRDAVGMAACYHDRAHFSDPVFQDLNAAEVKAMWGMLLERSTDLRILFNVLEESEAHGLCRWEALYTFSRTGRKVRNVVTSTFTIKDGLIIEQKDRFDMWCWARQALGTPGLLLGWSPTLRNKVRTTADAGLRKAMDKG